MFIGLKKLAYINLFKWSLRFIRGRFANNCVVFLRDFGRTHWCAYSAIPIRTDRLFSSPSLARDCWTKQGRGAARFVGFPGRYVTRQYLIYPWSAQSVPIPPFSPTILHLRIAFVIWRYCWAVAISLDPTPYPSRVRRATGAAATCRHCCGTESTRYSYTQRSSYLTFNTTHNMLHFACNKYESRF